MLPAWEAALLGCCASLQPLQASAAVLHLFHFCPLALRASTTPSHV